MKITSLLALGSAAAALLAIPALAQDAAPGARPARMATETTRAQAEQMAATMFARQDANGDGKLDAADRAARQQARFERLDTDGNGQLSPVEFSTRAERGQAGQRAGRRGHRGGGMALRAARANPDGMTQADFTAAALSRFDRMDANSDGIVTREERRAARPQRSGRTGGALPTSTQ